MKIIKRALISLLVLCFWLFCFEAFSRRVDLGFIIPGVKDTLLALIGLFKKRVFYQSLAYSLIRVLSGYIIGVLLGITAALLAVSIKPVDYLLSPLMTVLKATPVASFILVVWFLIGSSLVPTAIAVIMVMPIIYQNLTDGYRSIDPKLSEVCRVYSVGYLRRLRILVVPTLMKFLIPGLITSCGLAWKSAIAAEIITYTKYSLGQDIVDAKNYFESAEMFALTAVVIILSIIIERLIRLLARKVGRA